MLTTKQIMKVGRLMAQTGGDDFRGGAPSDTPRHTHYTHRVRFAPVPLTQDELDRIDKYGLKRETPKQRRRKIVGSGLNYGLTFENNIGSAAVCEWNEMCGVGIKNYYPESPSRHSKFPNVNTGENESRFYERLENVQGIASRYANKEDGLIVLECEKMKFDLLHDSLFPMSFNAFDKTKTDKQIYQTIRRNIKKKHPQSLNRLE